MTRSSCLALLLATTVAHADEGMWTFDNFPRAAVQKSYGFEPDQSWLDHVRLSSVRLGQGCSGSFVSPDGLVMTNHHCARRCIQDLSTAQQDLTAKGFYAATREQERTCPRMEINQLISIKDVTPRVQKAIEALSGKAFNDALRAEFARIEKECQTSDRLRCEVVTLYRGGMYQLYTYKRWKKDVRLVFAPEESVAFFGGDPDNFNFPRYDLDVSFLRVYEDGKPLQTPEYFRWSDAGAKEGELTFVSGNPGNSSRLLTVAQLAALRDVLIPLKLERLAQLRGWVDQYQQRSPEARRTSRDELFGVQNAYKAWFGRRDTLTDPVFFASKVKAEEALRERIAKDPKLAAKYGGAWEAIARASELEVRIERETTWIRSENKYYSDLFGIARNLVWGTEELKKPNTERYREFSDARLPQTELITFSKSPIHADLEVELFTLGLTKMREELGADHPYVRKVLGNDSPRQLATRVVRETKLYDVAVRRGLRDGGGRGLQGPDDRARPPPGPRDARRPQALRGRGGVGGAQERRAHRPGALRAGGHHRLSRRHVHRAALLRLGQGVDPRGWGGGEALHRHRRGVRPRHRGGALRSAGDVAEGEEQAEALHPVQLHHHQRHHRGQLRLADAEPEGGDRRAGLRREPGLAGR